MNICENIKYILLRVSAVIIIALMQFGCTSLEQMSSSKESKIEFRPMEVLDTAEGNASFYHNKFQGRLTANGERYNKKLFSAAHRTYPFGTIIRVTRIGTGKVVLVRINDRGPYVEGRLIDLSFAAAKELAMHKIGVVPVKIEVLSWGNDSSIAQD